MKTMKTTLRNTLLGALATLALTACGSDVQVKGKVSDGSGSQTQGLVSGATGFGGTGSASAAATVRAQVVLPTGELSLVTEAAVEAGGTYTLSLPEGSERIVLEAVDAKGEVVARGLLDATAGAKGGVRNAAPITSETSLEASVYMRLVAEGTKPDAIDTVDLRARIDAKLGAAIAAGQDDADATAEAILALAQGVRAAQEAELKVYAKAGKAMTQEQIFQSSLEASAKLDAALDAGTGAEAAWTAFWAELRAKSEMDERDASDGERAASASFRATVKAELGFDGDAVLTAAVRAAAAQEARAADAAIVAALKAGDASQAVIDAALEAGAALRADINAATSAQAVAQAWATWSVSVSGGASTSVLNAYLGAEASGSTQLDAALEATAAARVSLDTALSLAVGVVSTIDVSATVGAVVTAFNTYHAAVRTQASALSALGTRASPAVELMVVAQGSFRLN